MTLIVEWLAIILLILGALFILIGAIGLVKLPDFYTRLHAPTKASTLGIGSILIASMMLHMVDNRGINVQELVISLFLFITAPVSAYMMAKAAIHHDVPSVDRTQNPHISQTIKRQNKEHEK
jgi:multicomponent K+:H+ antiporter subunit G